MLNAKWYRYIIKYYKIVGDKRIKKVIFTIGHSNMSIEEFIDLLKNNKIELLVDVRSSPYSKYVSHFNRQDIHKSLNDVGIKYSYLGNKIGGKPAEKKYYTDGKVDYSLIEKGKPFEEGLSELMELAIEKKTVIMCSEEDPQKCHRHMLITPNLTKHDFVVFHIRKNGILEKGSILEKGEIQKTLFDNF